MRRDLMRVRVAVAALAACASIAGTAASALCADASVSQGSPTLEEYRLAVLSLRGDAARGQKVYEDIQHSRCKQCHAIEGVGSPVGPDLLGVGGRYDRATLLDTVLEPSKRIHPDYAASVIVTKDGKVHTGITRQINEFELEIVASETERVRVPLDQVEERRASTVSIMPSGLEKNIAPAQMADLLTYLALLKPSRTGSREEALDAREIPRSVDFVKFTPIISPAQAFERPVWFGPIPGVPGSQLVLEIDRGHIWLLEGEGPAAKKSLFLDISEETTGGEFTGLMSIAFHPDFVSNRRYFLKLHAIPPNGLPKIRENALQVNIIERRASADGRSDSGEPSKVIIEIPCFTVFHHGGDLAFGPDGYLYSSMGDTGPQGDPDGHSQDLSVLNGKMFRIDVDRSEGDLPYAIPSDNPFRNRAGARPEIWAVGFREIWRHCFDPVTGELYAAEVGQNRFEEINVVRGGENYGWNVREGFQPYSDRYRTEGAVYTPPVFAYGHDIGPSVTGGFVYRGKKYPHLVGKYIFGDYQTLRVWVLEQHDRKVESVVEIGRAPDKFGAFGLDADGELYLVGLDRGLIYRINFDGVDLSPSTWREIVQTSLETREPWQYTTEAPGAGWNEANFFSNTWASAPGPFGVRTESAVTVHGIPAAPADPINTVWDSSDIWMRREFTFAPPATDAERSIRQDDSVFKLVFRTEGEADVYLNGVLAARLSGGGAEYQEASVSPEAASSIREGQNLIAVHCRKTSDRPYVDVGLIEVQKIDASRATAGR